MAGTSYDPEHLGSEGRQFASALLVVLASVGGAVATCFVLSTAGSETVDAFICAPLLFVSPILGGYLAANRARLPYAASAFLAVCFASELVLLAAFGIPRSDYLTNLLFRSLMFVVPGLLTVIGRRSAFHRRNAPPPAPHLRKGS